MINRLKELGYTITIKYFFTGIITGFLVFVIIRELLTTGSISYHQFLVKEYLLLLISILTGVIIGGIVYLLITDNNLKRQYDIDKELWYNQISKSYKFFVLKNIFVFSIAGFIGFLVINIIDTHFDLSILFSRQYINDYISFIVAMAVYGLFMAIGKIKRLQSIFSNIKENN